MTATTHQTERAPTERTEHPHIVRTPGVLGGKSRIDGTRISVLHVLTMYKLGGESVESIAETYGLNPAHVHDAISYGLDHLDEMRRDDERRQLRSVLRENDMVYAGGRLIVRERLKDTKISPETPIYTWETLPDEFDHQPWL